MSRQTEISYKTVDFLRFPLIMAVVLIHCDYPTNTLCDVRDTAPIFFAIQQFFQHHIYTVAVPLFFFISGYLFFRNGIPDANGLRNKVTARVHTLLIPYLLWNTAGMLLFLLKAGPLLGFFPQYADFGHTIPELLQGYLALPYNDWMYPYAFSLWFIRNLIIIIAFIPMVCMLLRYLKGFAFIVPAILATVFPEFCFGIFTSLLYFVSGACLPISGTDLSELLKKLKFYPSILWAVLLFSVCILHCDVIATDELSTVNTFLGLYTMLYIGLLSVRKGISINPVLARATFFIYAFHALYASVAMRIGITLLDPHNEFMAVLTYIFIFLSEAGLAFIAYLTFNRISPRTVAILCGNRS